MADRVPKPPRSQPPLAPQSVLDASPNAVLAVDQRGVIVYANGTAEATFGWPRGALLGEPIEALVPPAVGKRHVTHRGSFIAHRAPRPMGIGLDLSGRRRDGTEFPVEISLVPIETPDGPIVYATVVDITARKHLEEQLLQAQKMESVGRLAGGIAHDFNNMLFAIRGYADILAEDLDAAGTHIPVSAVRPSVAAITTAAERASLLTAQLLAFSRRQVVQPVTLDLGEAVASVEPMLRRVIGEQVRLVLSVAGDTGTVRADPSQLDQILINLTVNARDAMPGGGTITIETANVVFDDAYALEHFQVEPGSYVMLAVSDTGQGMDRETRLHVFEPFFTTKEPGKGTGLGLSTIYGIVRQAGGHIWVYSEPGRGTTFKIYLPRVDGSAFEAHPRRTPVDRRQSGTVLLVEDDPTVREMSRRILDRGGYVVIAPADSREALALIESGTAVDVVVTDLVMPDLSGAELARRTREARPEVAIVLLSGYSAESAEIEDLVARGAVFASKPLGTRELMKTIEEARAKVRAG